MAKRKQKKSSFTVLIIPNSESKIGKWRLPGWVFTALFALAVVSVAVAVYFTVSYRNLEDEVAQLQYLKDVTQKQAQEIYQLQQFAAQAEEELDRVGRLDTEVRELVGFEPADSGASGRSNLKDSSFSSRNDQGIVPSSRIGAASLGIAELDALQGRLEDIYLRTGQSVAMLNELKEDTAARLEYLEAVPNLWPIQGRITSPYGNRKSPFTGRPEFHNGLDIASRSGTPVAAAATGTVQFSGWKAGYGEFITISHGYNFSTGYGHLSKILVKQGEKVQKGDIIGRVGSTGRSTGPHLHLEILVNGQTVDPLTYLK